MGPSTNYAIDECVLCGLRMSKNGLDTPFTSARPPSCLEDSSPSSRHSAWSVNRSPRDTIAAVRRWDAPRAAEPSNRPWWWSCKERDRKGEKGKWRISKEDNTNLRSSSSSYLQLIGAIEGLCQTITVLQVVLHLEGIYLGIGLLGWGAEFPHQHTEGPRIAGFGELLVLQCLQWHPLNGTILTVAQTVVVGGEEISRERTIREFDAQLIVNAVEGREGGKEKGDIIAKALLRGVDVDSLRW